ncbi:hypothetical protein Q3H58_004847 [Pseudomonas psychrotolerans]|nr:hypothetical protein [Pseudomonas psychrotolerans]
MPSGIVGVLHCQWREHRFLAAPCRGIGLEQFVDHHLHRPAIRNDMVQGDDQHMLMRVPRQQKHP